MSLALIVWIFICSAATLKLAISSGFAAHVALDTPNRRSLHAQPTPRGAGLFFLPWVIAGGLFAEGSATIFGGAAVLAVISFLDDRKGLPVHVRFASHFAVALLASWVMFSDSVVIWLACALAIAWTTNLYNFMDGADGMAGSMAVFGFGAYAICAWIAGFPALMWACASIAAGGAAFLIFNFPPARIFLGDVGSIPLGFLAATLGLHGWREGAWPLWFPALVFSPFILDATLTLLRRLFKGERVWKAHREHSYQRLVRSGWSHRRLLFSEWALMAGVALTAICLTTASQWLVIVSLAGWSALYLVLLVVIELYWRRTKSRGSRQSEPSD